MTNKDHPHNKSVLNRLSRISGHVDAIKGMIQNGRDCSDVLIQISAVISALNNTGKIILKDHISHCVKDAVVQNDESILESLNDAIDKFIK